MTIEEMRKMDTADLEKKIVETKDELFKLRMEQSNGTLRETRKIHDLRKTIARLKTVLNEKERGN